MRFNMKHREFLIGFLVITSIIAAIWTDSQLWGWLVALAFLVVFSGP